MRRLVLAATVVLTGVAALAAVRLCDDGSHRAKTPDPPAAKISQDDALIEPTSHGYCVQSTYHGQTFYMRQPGSIRFIKGTC